MGRLVVRIAAVGIGAGISLGIVGLWLAAPPADPVTLGMAIIASSVAFAAVAGCGYVAVTGDL